MIESIWFLFLKKILPFLVIYVSGELLALPVFSWMRKTFERVRSEGSSKRSYSRFRGMLERFFLFLGLVNFIQAVLVVFGAIKIGTRLNEEKDNGITNDYFIIGNLLSIVLAIIYFMLWAFWVENL